MKAVINLFRDWKREQAHNRNPLKLSRKESFSIIFVIGFLSTLFLCILGVIQQAYIYFEMGDLVILGYNNIPAWIPAIGACMVSTFGFIMLSKEADDNSASTVGDFSLKN